MSLFIMDFVLQSYDFYPNAEIFSLTYPFQSFAYAIASFFFLCGMRTLSKPHPFKSPSLPVSLSCLTIQLGAF
ncbi:MAG: hypothetical protein LAT68_14650 [Cyclobacteriaceae bacterium]|nr:hypothetical protein [Cyclobacteriaceae bacterium]MCH8517560.1 hypothetical protein [Cyclobacteriaceae bacterium]